MVESIDEVDLGLGALNIKVGGWMDGVRVG
jgi:hypothetical protein